MVFRARQRELSLSGTIRGTTFGNSPYLAAGNRAPRREGSQDTVGRETKTIPIQSPAHKADAIDAQPHRDQRIRFDKSSLTQNAASLSGLWDSCHDRFSLLCELRSHRESRKPPRASEVRPHRYP